MDVITTGAVNWDVNLFVDSIVTGGMEAPVKKITRVPGGKAANVAVAAARLLGPGRAGILGAVGDDEIGRAHREIFSKEGVSTDCLLNVEGHESGQAYILVDAQGRNQIFTHFGANGSLTSGMARSESVSTALRDAKILVAMDPPLDYTSALFERVPDGVLVIWGPGVRTLNHEKEVLELLSKVNYLLLNQQELSVLTGKDTPKEGYAMARKGAPALKLIVTLGERGAVLYTGDDVESVEGVDLKSAGLNVVNTVGCGDAFVGCFAASLASGYSEADALTRANFAGAFKSTRMETRGSPTEKELAEFMGKLR